MLNKIFEESEREREREKERKDRIFHLFRIPRTPPSLTPAFRVPQLRDSENSR